MSRIKHVALVVALIVLVATVSSAEDKKPDDKPITLEEFAAWRGNWDQAMRQTRKTRLNPILRNELLEKKDKESKAILGRKVEGYAVVLRLTLKQTKGSPIKGTSVHLKMGKGQSIVAVIKDDKDPFLRRIQPGRTKVWVQGNFAPKVQFLLENVVLSEKKP